MCLTAPDRDTARASVILRRATAAPPSECHTHYLRFLRSETPVLVPPAPLRISLAVRPPSTHLKSTLHFTENLHAAAGRRTTTQAQCPQPGDGQPVFSYIVERRVPVSGLASSFSPILTNPLPPPLHPLLSKTNNLPTLSSSSSTTITVSLFTDR